ncbi:unnamed protein product [Ambrosiozyma monospora]|uniref:Unnamed protein product n=1 Tax=Ambrosiozyma monospora TaxID=43982 RepID=A0ACB5SYQ2_AMBMO|nr:unnamed protein product [Ambrosiozyma monospora]
MIGRQLDFYKQFYNSDTDHNFDFIFIKDIQHFFRVSTAGEMHDNNSDSAWFFKSHFSSAEQVQQLEKLCDNLTEKLKLKRDLIIAGITDPTQQELIIDDFDLDFKKTDQLQSVQHQERASGFKKTMCKDENTVKNFTAVKLVKGLFKTTEVGELDITLTTTKKNSIDSIVPEVLERISVSENVTSTTDHHFNYLDTISKDNISPSKSHKFTPILSLTSLKSSSKSSMQIPERKKTESIFESSTNTSSSLSSKSGKQSSISTTKKNIPVPRKASMAGIRSKLLTTKRNKESTNRVPSSTPNSFLASAEARSASHEFKIELTFNPSHDHHTGSLSTQPPASIKIKPRLQVLTIQSDKPIPITIDGKFLMESSA